MSGKMQFEYCFYKLVQHFPFTWPIEVPFSLGHTETYDAWIFFVAGLIVGGLANVSDTETSIR